MMEIGIYSHQILLFNLRFLEGIKRHKEYVCSLNDAINL